MAYLLHILIFINIYIIIAISLNLIAGYTGILSIAHAGFYGVGAYISALMAVHFGTPFVLNLICAMLFAGFVSAIVAIPSLRIHDDYLVIATFGFQMILFSQTRSATFFLQSCRFDEKHYHFRPQHLIFPFLEIGTFHKK